MQRAKHRSNAVRSVIVAVATSMALGTIAGGSPFVFASERALQMTSAADEPMSLPFTQVRALPAKAPLPADAKPANLSRIQLKSAGTAIVLSEGRLLQSANAGAAWRDIGPPSASNISTIQFVDERHGWALDRWQDFATVWRTVDGGANWSSSTVPLVGDAASVNLHFADATHGFLIARIPSGANFSLARFYATRDAGETWLPLADPPAMGEIRFASATRGWLLGGANGRTLYQTVDAGASWQQIRYTKADSRARVEFALPMTANGLSIVPVLTTLAGEAANTQVLRQFAIDDQGALAELSRAELVGNGMPARLVNADASIVLAGNVNTVRQVGRAASPLPIVVDTSGTATSISEYGGVRWLLTQDGNCAGKESCTSAQQLLSIGAGGKSAAVTLPTRSGHNAQPLRVLQSTRRGFDVCEVPSVSTLQTWWNSSPYRDVNFYMGGRNRACSQPLLNASWITQALNMGWGLIPTWVGYQSPSTSCTSCAKFSTNSTTARQQGIDEADLAANAAETLGITKPNVIYFNLEQYNTETASEKSFIDGWSERLRQRGYVPSMYVHWTNVNSFVSLANPPQSVWVARWSGVGGTAPSTAPDPNAITGVSNSIFVNNRIWQHYGEVGQTWGGVNIPGLDLNVANGPVIGKDLVSQPQTITFNALADRVINTAAFNVGATASSGLPVTFISLAPTICTVSGTRTTLLAVGTCTLRASQAGDATYAAAANVEQSFQIAAQSQTITFGTIASRILSPASFDLNATTSSGLLATYSSLTTTVCTVDGDRLFTVALGTCTVRAGQAGNARVLAAASVDQSFPVVSPSSCSLTVTTNDCDMDGIPNGVEAGVGRSASVRDNDVFAQTNLFIMQVFRDFLKREATAAEISSWTTEFNAGRQTRASMIESFFTRADFGAKHAPVARLYLAFFNRVPQFSGQQYWVGQLGTKTLAQIADAFAASAEFSTTYGTLDDTPYVNRVYQNTLGRAPTAAELTTALNDLASAAKTRGSLMTSLSEGSTHVAATKNEVNAIMTYWGMLQRRADQSGFDYWVGQLDAGTKTAQGMISGFLASPEYRARFLP